LNTTNQLKIIKLFFFRGKMIKLGNHICERIICYIDCMYQSVTGPYAFKHESNLLYKLFFVGLKCCIQLKNFTNLICNSTQLNWFPRLNFAFCRLCKTCSLKQLFPTWIDHFIILQCDENNNFCQKNNNNLFLWCNFLHRRWFKSF